MSRAWWTALAAVTVVACSRAQEDETVTPAPEPVTVIVSNGYALPVEVEAVGAGTRIRLGTVHPGMEATFTIPPNLVSTTTVELEARAAGNTRVGRSGPLMLSPGAIVDFTVTSQLFNSTANIR